MDSHTSYGGRQMGIRRQDFTAGLVAKILYNKGGGTMKVRSVKFRIVFMAFEIVLISCLILGTLSIYFSSNTSNAEAMENVKLQTSIQVEKLNSTLQKIEQSVDSLSATTIETIDDFKKFKADTSYEEECTNKLKVTSKNTMLSTDGAMNIYIRYNPEFTNPTSGLFLDGSSGKVEYLTPTDFSSYDPSDLAHVGWYYIPVQAGVPTWMDPYLNENINVYMISYVVPIFIDDTSVGIVGMDVDFTKVQEIVSGVELYKTGYAYLVNANNQVMYHKDYETGSDLAEQDREAAEFISDADNEGKVVKVGKNVMIYQTLDNGMKYVMCVPYSEVTERTSQLTGFILGSAVICLILAMAVALFEGFSIAKPITQLTEIILKTADFNFTPNPKSQILMKKKDEIGDMARAVHGMRKKLKGMVESITQSSQGMTGNVGVLENSALSVLDIAQGNTALTEELAAAMEETNASTEKIKDNLETVNLKAREIKQLSDDGTKLSGEIKVRAEQLKKSTAGSADKTKQMYEDVKTQAEAALEKSKAVEKIDMLTTAIAEISSQTGLLALNASIEAARAGEAGRGFAVVASEISTLANQTADTVSNIDVIVQEVNEAVADMLKCLDISMGFMGETVLEDYKEFSQVGVQYKEDASVIEDSMTRVSDAINALTGNIQEITNAVENISMAISESSDGINEIAEKTVTMSSESHNNTEIVEESKKLIEKLNGIADMFTI